MKNQPQDTSWPPLNVQDLSPDYRPVPETMKFSTVRAALEARVCCPLCKQPGHFLGKECSGCCSTCGEERDEDGFCEQYCLEKKTRMELPVFPA